jgi:hypothetical protein
MTDKEKIAALQTILGVTADSVFGPASRAALESLTASATIPVAAPDGAHAVKASSFADPADVRAFKRCKERGGSDQDCFKVGDNGIGAWGDDCSEGSGASCALPPDDMISKWGSVEAAKHKPVYVTANNTRITCILRDRMPWKKNITNGAGIDLNPDSVRALGLEPPLMTRATWQWV